MKGWYGNRYGHSLASRGISVRQIKDIYNFPEVIDYEDPEEFIVAFWIASLKNDFSEYNFDKVFRYTQGILTERMNRYGYLSFEEFYMDFNADFNIMPLADDYCEVYDWFGKKHENDCLKQNVTYEMAIDVYNILNKDREESLAGIDPTYDKLFEIYNEMEELPTNLRDKIIFMDKIIDIQHHRGSIWEDNEFYDPLDVEELRNKFERDYRMIR